MSETDKADGLRQRKTANNADSGSHNNSKMDTAFFTALADSVPASVKPTVLAIAPYCGTIMRALTELIHHSYILYVKACEIWVMLGPYKPELLFPSLIGLIMCFFGGSFVTLIAAVEAYKLCGYETSINCIKNLYEDFQRFNLANKADDLADDNHDGTADVQQINKSELARRKTLLFLRTVDPKRVSEAIAGLNAGFLAVVATLKLQFAKSITLGQAIGSIVERPALLYGLPVVESLLPQEYKRWAAPLVSYPIKAGAISLAWLVQRVISAFHSAIRGGNMFGKNIVEYLNKMGYITLDAKDTILDEVLGYAVAALGLYFQLSYGFGLPWFLAIPLFPFSILERYLMWVVNSK